MKKKMKIFGWFIAVAVICTAIGLVRPIINRLRSQSETAAVASNSPGADPTEKLLEINDVEFKGVSNFDQTRKILFGVVTPDVDLEIKVNDDPTIHPYSVSDKDIHTIFPDGNLIRFRVRPGQEKKTALIITSLPKRTGY